MPPTSFRRRSWRPTAISAASAAKPRPSSSPGCVRSWPRTWPTCCVATSARRAATCARARNPRRHRPVLGPARPRPGGAAVVAEPAGRAPRTGRPAGRRPGSASRRLPRGARAAPPRRADVSRSRPPHGTQPGQRRETLDARPGPAAAGHGRRDVNPTADRTERPGGRRPAPDPRGPGIPRGAGGRPAAGSRRVHGAASPTSRRSLAAYLDALDMVHGAGPLLPRPPARPAAGVRRPSSPRRFSHRPRDRPRRHGRRLRGGAAVAGPARRPQGAAVRGGTGRPPAAALQERGPGGGATAPHQHRAGLRRRLRARRPLLRHAAHRGPEPRRPDLRAAIASAEDETQHDRPRPRPSADGAGKSRRPRRPPSRPPSRRRRPSCRRSPPAARPSFTVPPRPWRPRRPTPWNTPTSSASSTAT